MSLARHLENQRNVLTEFIQLLEDEQKLLSGSTIDGDAIKKLADRKKVMLNHIDSMESMRATGQEKLGYPTGVEGAKKAADDGKCLGAWEQIITLAFRAKELNEVNGTLIHMRLDYANKMVGFFNKVSGDPLYGADGKAKRRGLGGITTSA